MTKGVVYLVGAGPGDPDLLTLKGRRRIEVADCLVYDRLVHPRILAHAPEHAERIYVGKQADSPVHCTPQNEINRILIEKARLGKCVVRVKGGDPFLFARGAEEALALQQAGIRYEIVAGLTTALASAATASVPLTHRGAASAVAFVTGHEDPDKSDAINWEPLARFPGTLVVYMGYKRIGLIARELIRHGRAESTPATLIEWGGTNSQKVATRTLCQLVDNPKVEDFTTPVLTIIGDVCSLRDKLGWFENRPLFGQGVLVPRPRHQAAEMVRALEDLGARVYAHPVLEILPPDDWTPVDDAICSLSAYDWLIFTSRNGVAAFLNRLMEVGGDLRRLGRLKLAAIGPATADELSKWRLKADLIPGQYRSESLVEELAPQVTGKRLLLPRADRGREVLTEGLDSAAAAVHQIAVYRQADVDKPSPEVAKALKQGRVQWIMCTSSNIARGVIRWLDDELKGRLGSEIGLVSISPVTTSAIGELGLVVAAEADQYTVEGTIEALVAAAEVKAQTRFPGPAKK